MRSVKLKDGTTIRVPKNELNKGLFPMGKFCNIPMIEHNNEWQSCSLRFDGNKVQVMNVRKVDPITSVVSDFKEGLYKECDATNFQRSRLLCLMGDHALNWRIFRFKRMLVNRKQTIKAFALAITASVLYFIANKITGGTIKEWISKNPYADLVMMFLTVCGSLGW